MVSLRMQSALATAPKFDQKGKKEKRKNTKKKETEKKGEKNIWSGWWLQG